MKKIKSKKKNKLNLKKKEISKKIKSKNFRTQPMSVSDNVRSQLMSWPDKFRAEKQKMKSQKNEISKEK